MFLQFYFVFTSAYIIIFVITLMSRDDYFVVIVVILAHTKNRRKKNPFCDVKYMYVKINYLICESEYSSLK